MLKEPQGQLNICLECVTEDKKTGLRISLNPVSFRAKELALALPNSEHLGATRRAYALCRRLAILHGYGFRILYFLFGTAFKTICLHLLLPLSDLL